MKNKFIRILLILFFFFIIVGCEKDLEEDKVEKNNLELKTYTVYEMIQYGQKWTEEDLKSKNMKITLEIKEGNVSTMLWNGNIQTYKYDELYFTDSVNSTKYKYHFEDDS